MSRSHLARCRAGEIERFLRDGETAYVAVADDVADFSDRMVRALDDVPRATAIGAAGRRIAEERFAYGPQGLRLKELVERVCRAGLLNGRGRWGTDQGSFFRYQPVVAVLFDGLFHADRILGALR